MLLRPSSSHDETDDLKDKKAEDESSLVSSLSSLTLTLTLTLMM